MNSEMFYQRMRERLLKGEWSAGQRLPSIRHQINESRTSHHAIVSAYDRLAAEGLIEAQQGRGYFVSGHLAGQGSGGQRADTLSDLAAREISDAVSPMHPSDPMFALLQSRPEAIKLSGGWLPTEWRNTELLARSIRRTARLEQRALVEYGDIQGYRPLRQQLSRHLQNKTRASVPPTQIITTLGATQALDLVIRLLIRPGDVVLVDEPGNGNLNKLIALGGGEVIGVPRTPTGPDTAFIAELLTRRRVRALVCNSTFHNPTGGSLSARNAFDLLRLAIAHDFLIIEDDVYGDFSSGDHQSFADLDDLDHVIYIGSFSKSLSSSLRIGYIACCAEMIEPLLQLKLLTSVSVPSFCERFVNTILSDGSYLRHMRKVQRDLMAQQASTRKLLEDRGWTFDIIPEGGMFLWARHPGIRDMDAFIRRLAEHDVLLLPGSVFTVGNRREDALRINVAHFTPEMASLFDPGAAD
ncbi:transcriptional regulator, GntR family [Kushneria avicenniae]|uniref:Transcriptional regulator, GntR family n=1 Tax=Kushneria avicenniae TaxID=402385 RepID=A0A1I1JHU1_9GAMM|nr:PLP-dependent aminotransferase family protein [Kushneria avicenniae]SFC48199.1 transcriptional regulator, GntR family [Kushneria avicenniae]